MTVYLSKLYCVCILWNNLDFDHIQNIKTFEGLSTNPINFEVPVLVWLKFNEQDEVDNRTLEGIDLGCQVNKYFKGISKIIYF